MRVLNVTVPLFGERLETRISNSGVALSLVTADQTTPACSIDCTPGVTPPEKFTVVGSDATRPFTPASTLATDPLFQPVSASDSSLAWVYPCTPGSSRWYPLAPRIR